MCPSLILYTCTTDLLLPYTFTIPCFHEILNIGSGLKLQFAYLYAVYSKKAIFKDKINCPNSKQAFLDELAMAS